MLNEYLAELLVHWYMFKFLYVTGGDEFLVS
jgi:hypothetical protein